ncbi:hypothetical protein LC607_35990, partial [Nostoc sp. CHAB 5824]|nr:hypothetical protein [Nostoc sp. CHAB 5824]
MLPENISPKNEQTKPKQRLTPKAMLELKRVSEPRLHPDGSRVAFTVTEADFEESRWVSHLYLTEWEGREQDMQTGGQGDKGTGGDNSQRPDDPNPQSLIPNPSDEDRTRQLTFSYEGESNSRWSPDG